MKAYRIELLVIDFDGIGGDEIQAVLEAERFPNDCINLSVKRVDSQDIGAWTDDHPLNRAGTSSAEYERLFGSDRLAEEKAREALGIAVARMQRLLDEQDHCGSYEHECPLHDAHKDYDIAGELPKLREALRLLEDR